MRKRTAKASEYKNRKRIIVSLPLVLLEAIDDATMELRQPHGVGSRNATIITLLEGGIEWRNSREHD